MDSVSDNCIPKTEGYPTKLPPGPGGYVANDQWCTGGQLLFANQLRNVNQHSTKLASCLLVYKRQPVHQAVLLRRTRCCLPTAWYTKQSAIPYTKNPSVPVPDRVRNGTMLDPVLSSSTEYRSVHRVSSLFSTRMVYQAMQLEHDSLNEGNPPPKHAFPCTHACANT